MKDIADLLGRFFIASIFLFQGISNLVEGIDNKVQLVNYNGDYNINFAIGITLMIAGGLLVLIGYRAKLGALLLLLFMIPITFFYPIEQLLDAEYQAAIFKNIAIIGGLFMILAHGTGKYSVRRILARTTS